MDARSRVQVKTTQTRKSRPLWARDDKSLMSRVIGDRLLRRWTIARMYWRENKTARDIAKHLHITVNAVECVINRLR